MFDLAKSYVGSCSRCKPIRFRVGLSSNQKPFTYQANVVPLTFGKNEMKRTCYRVRNIFNLWVFKHSKMMY